MIAIHGERVEGGPPPTPLASPYVRTIPIGTAGSAAQGRKIRRNARIAIAVALVVAVLAWVAFVVPHSYHLSKGPWATVRGTLAWLPTIASHLPRTFAVTAVVVAAMAGPGALVLRLFGVTWHDRFEHWVFSLAAGLAAWVPVVLVTGSTVGLGRGTVVVITVVYLSPCLYFAARLVWLLGSGRTGVGDLPVPRRIPGVEIALCIVGLALLYYSLLGALQPEVNFDARWYHLGSASHYVEVGRFYDIVAATHDPAMGLNPYQEITLTGLFSLVGVHGARLLAFFDGAIICLAIVAFARSHLGSVRIGLVAALAFLAIPSVSWASATAYNDLPVALYTLLSVHALVTWCKAPGRWGWAYLGIAAAAFSFGVKAFGLFTLALAFACVVTWAVTRSNLRRPITAGRLVIGALVAIVTCLPWWIRSYSMTNNPVFPLLNSVFHSEYWNSYAAATQASANRKVSIGTLPQGLVRSVWTTVADPAPYHSLVGSFFLIGIPIALVLALCTTRRARRTVLFLALYVVAWSCAWYLSAVSDSRYLLAVAPLACLALVTVMADAVTHARFGRVLPVVGASALVLVGLSTTQVFLPFVLGGGSPAVLGTVSYKWRYLFQGEPERDVQLRYLPMVEFINAYLPARTTKIYDGDSLNAVYLYIHPELFNGNGYGSPGTMRQWRLADPDAYARLRENGVTDVVVPTSSVAALSAWPVWRDLRQTYISPDGLVLFHVVSPSPLLHVKSSGVRFRP
jgi:hypothetical protein